MSSRGGRWRRALRGVAVATAVSIVVTSCVGAGDTAADPASTSSGPVESTGARTGAEATTPPPEPDPAPQPGDCHRIDAADLRTIVHEERAVPCRRRHTAVTFHVGRIPEPAARSASSSGDEQVENAADRICDSRFRGYVGGGREDRLLSLLDPTYFLPSREQFELGARWVRCDAYAYAKPSRVATLPRSLENAFERDRVRSAFTRCSPVSPSHPRFRHVTCGQPHQWRAVATLPLGRAGERFPGRGTVEGRARDRCEQPVREYLGTDDAFSFGFEVPQRSAWGGGDRTGLCWARTTR